MSEVYFFSFCPKCKANNEDNLGNPELTGYIGDQVKCSSCKTRFVVSVVLQAYKKGGSKGELYAN